MKPGASRFSTVELIQAVFHTAGLEGPAISHQARELTRAISSDGHLLFVLIDGLGLELLRRHSPDGFLARHTETELQAVFPSTTAAALTSFATGTYPARHGATGWWVYLPKHDVTATALPFTERFSGRDLRECGVTAEELFPVPSLLPKLPRPTLTITPEPFLEDVFLRYSTGGGPAVGYEQPAQALEFAVEQVRRAKSPGYISVYLPQVDALCHSHGVDAPEVSQMISYLDRLIAELHERVAGSARLIVTADHGQVALPNDRVLYLDEGEPLLECLLCPPTGEPTVPYFHLSGEDPDGFRHTFRDRYGDAFTLITPEEAERLKLYGPGPLSAHARARLGDLIGLSAEPTALHYRRRGETVTPNLGVHAGLTRGEMVVPLVVV